MTQESSTEHIRDLVLSALGMNAAYVVDVYSLYCHNPETVSADWRQYFGGLERGELSPHEFPRATAVLPGKEPVASEVPPAPLLEGEELLPLRGGSALIVKNMEESLGVPTATSYRDIPVKALEENRRFLNHALAISGSGKVSFTHLIAWALVKAVADHPALGDAFRWVGEVPHRVRRTRLNLGIAVDLERRDGSRNLLVPRIADAGAMDFKSFVGEYNRIIERTRTGKLEPEDFHGTSITLTNPGTVGTTASVPRLVEGQGAIVAVGSIGYSAETRSMAPEVLSRLGISKRMTISCTYDHRIIQGAVSGLFLAQIERHLQGEDEFYDEIFESMGIPYHPVRWTPDVSPSEGEGVSNVQEITRQARVIQLINAYRVRGHLIADLDPLGDTPQYHPELDIQTYGLTLWDLDRSFITGSAAPKGTAWGAPLATLRSILQRVRATYCGKIGIEYMNIQDPDQKLWIQNQVEPDTARSELPDEQRKRMLSRLIQSETLEKFLQVKYMGYKRFSLEGAEALIPILDQLMEGAAEEGIGDVVMGMSHRGRLNVLIQSVGMDPARLFAEFQGNRDPYATQGSGDVKYHLGATGLYKTAAGNELKVSLSPNPSHLESVDPVVEGIARAKQDQQGGEDGRRRILPVLIHGDAAFAGQGVVAETLNLSQLHGYRTGGTVHIIVNNQIGFTTPVESARSSPYPTDVAKMGQVPIFHVNGDDPEAVVRVVRWALAFRQAFEKDVVIDMFCYRRHGHNEADEPSYTQPRLYSKIKKHASVAALYGERLAREGLVSAEDIDALRTGARTRLQEAFDRSQRDGNTLQATPIEALDHGPAIPRPTAVSRDTLEGINAALLQVPDSVDVHPKLLKWMEQRSESVRSGEGIDWAFAETLAFGSLLLEGVPIRLSGQDSVRGTFSQRHLLLRDDHTDTSWMGLRHLHPGQAPFYGVDSPLSEEAVLGFEFGYSMAYPNSLVIWEAQFGDFINEAQVVVDQFIAGSKEKWGQPSSLVLLLPHGYEGQGPDHSSARLERFLQLAAEDNFQVVNCTTPAQYFHLLRRQMCEGVREPLVVMAPKSLLRNPQAVSSVDDLTGNRFKPLLLDPRESDPRGVRRVILCSGKVFYDLAAARDAGPSKDAVVIHRVEELYPFPDEELRLALARHGDIEVVWVQEEPRNMGGWHYMADRLRTMEGMNIVPRYVGRKESASTATGYHDVHIREQQQLVEEALRF